MWANTCWGFLSFAVAFALARLSMIWTTGHEHWGPILLWAAGVCVALSVLCFMWPTFKQRNWIPAKDKRMPMRDAAALAYGQLRAIDSIFTGVADRYTESHPGETKEERVLLYMVSAMALKGLPLYGKHPPSQEYERIDPDEFKLGRFANGGGMFLHHGDKAPKYLDISVQASDLKKTIASMKQVTSTAI
jgi:hypothetical protein